jgi:DNA replication protein DnaC
LLLVIDELGGLPPDPVPANSIFQVMSRATTEER